MHHTRKIHLDLIRLIACFLVIVNHTNSYIFLNVTPESKKWWLSITIFFVAKLAVPLFLMVSGACLLGRFDGYRRAGQRFARIAAVLVLFSLVNYLDIAQRSGSAISVRDFLVSIYQSNITGSYWYLYLYLGMLIMLPLLQKISTVFDRRDYCYYAFWAIGFLGVMPILIRHFPILAYCEHFRLPLFHAFVALFLLGYFFEHMVTPTRRKTAAAIAVLVLTIALQVVLTYGEFMRTPDNYLYYDNTLLALIDAGTLAAFYLVRTACLKASFSARLRTIIHTAGRLTFGTYLLSDLLIRRLLPQPAVLLDSGHPFAAVTALQLAVFAIGMVISWGLVHVPGLKKLL